MKHWKRLLSCVLAGSVALALAACGQQSAGGSSAGNQSTDQSADQSREEASSPAAQSTAGSGADTSGTESGAGSGSVLVVYYSATGNTETVAGYIAQATGATSSKSPRYSPIPDDDLNWSDSDSRVTREHEDESLRDVELTTTQVENWDSYDTVFLGYPIWWGIAAWPVDGFVEANDFTGKTVIPFCTSSSSAWERAGSCWQNWQVPATGRRGIGSAPAPARRM